MAINPSSIMRQDPRILAQIGNPTGGALTQLGGMYSQGQMNNAKMKMVQQEQAMNAETQKTKLADIQSKLMLGFTDDLMDQVSAGVDKEKLKKIQIEKMRSAPPQFQKMIGQMLKQPFESYEDIVNANKRATKIQEALNPKEKKTFANKYQTGYIKTIGTEVLRQGRSINGRAQVQTSNGFRDIDPETEILISTISTAGKDELSVGNENQKPSKANENWEVNVIDRANKASDIIANNQTILNLNNQIEGGSFTELGALIGNFSESVLGVPASVFSNNRPSDVVAQLSVHTAQQLQKSEYIKGNASNREHRDLGIAQGTHPDNPNKAVAFRAKMNVGISQKDADLGKAWDEYTSKLEQPPTYKDYAEFRVGYNEKSNKSPMLVIFDRNAGVDGYKWKWEYDIQIENSVRRALMTIKPLSDKATSDDVDTWLNERARVENELRTKSEQKWMTFAAKYK